SRQVPTKGWENRPGSNPNSGQGPAREAAGHNQSGDCRQGPCGPSRDVCPVPSHLGSCLLTSPPSFPRLLRDRKGEGSILKRFLAPSCLVISIDEATVGGGCVEIGVRCGG